MEHNRIKAVQNKCERKNELIV